MSKRVTRLEDLARLANVSIATVSRALNDSPSVRTETKRRIWALAREHDYALRHRSPVVPVGASPVVAVVIPVPQGRAGRLDDPFFLELTGGLGQAARESNCDILVSHVVPTDFDEIRLLMSSLRADGIIFLGQSVLHDVFNRLAEQETNFIVWGAELPGQRYCSVGSDNVKGGRRATAHLARLGHKRIAFFGAAQTPEMLQRFQGFSQALESAGLSVDDDLVLPIRFEIESAEHAVHRLLGKGVTYDAIFCASDLIALGAIRGLEKAGIRVPEDIAVVGYDDILLARYSRPALTTISQAFADAGRLMVSKLLNAPEGVEIQSERLPTTLIIRESCGA